MTTQRSITTRLLLSAVLASGLASAAVGAEPETRSVTVRYDDLNIANPAGAQKLYSRIRNAAKVACGSRSSRPLVFASAAKQCEREAIDDAVQKVNKPVLTAMHKEKSQRRLG